MFIARFDVVMTPYDVVEPDLLVVLGDQLDILTDKNIRGAPDRNRIMIHRRAADGSFPLVATLAASETLTTPLLPGWGLPLDTLFR